jgi:hypothetical protein
MWICFDIETSGRTDVAHLIPEPEADKRLSDPVKIAADIERKRSALIERLPLDENGNRIVFMGYQTDMHDAPAVMGGENADERHMLENFWQYANGRTLIGYYSRLFDLRTIIQRSRILHVKHPNWRDLTAPYGRSKRHIDLFDEATMDATRSDGVIPRRLGSFCHTFGVDVPSDETDGALVAELLKAGNYEAVRKHCEIDVIKTVALARRLGIIPAAAPVGDPVLVGDVLLAEDVF